jgi:hypothetical protein
MACCLEKEWDGYRGVHHVIVIILSQIYKAHFRFIFNEKPSITIQSLAIIRKDIKRYQE